MGWSELKENTVDEFNDVKIHIAIKHKSGAVEMLHNHLLDVSLPTSLSYGKYSLINDLVKMMKPADKDIISVKLWAQKNDVELFFNRYNDFATSTINKTKMEHLFDCNLKGYVHSNTYRHHFTAVNGYTNPIPSSIEFIAGITEPFPRTHTLKTRRAPTSLFSDILTEAPCLYDSATPECLKSHYQINSTGTNTNNSMAVIEFAGSFFSPSDLAKFQKQFDLPNQPVAKIIGNNGDDPGTEASLDVQAILGIAPGVPLTFIIIAKTDTTPFLTYAIGQNDALTTPLVHSISWGTEEYDYAADGNLNRMNVELMKLAARGVSVLFATGDDGAGCYQLKYETNYPASSPYVTAVGGTWIPPVTSSYKIEGDEISGGGFARELVNNRSVATWQESAVSMYLKNSKCPNPKLFNPNGRGIPDVSAYDAYYPVFKRGNQEQVDGTSAAAPVWAGIIALLNDARLNAGKPAMGFLNPWLYSLGPGAFTDITKGRNDGDGISKGACYGKGFPAVKGWDPVTGIGTPIFPELLKAAMDN